MSLAIRLRAETARSLAFGSISGTYAGIGAAMTKPVRIFLLQNLTDATLWFSFDGVADTVPLPSNGFILLDVTSNKTLPQGFFLAEGDRIYVKTLGTPTSGAVYLTTFYGAEA